MRRIAAHPLPHVTIGVTLGSAFQPGRVYPHQISTHLKRDGTAGAWLMSMAARPHQPKNAARFIDDLARHCYFISSGVEHPLYPRRNKRAADDLDKPLDRVMADFRKGLAAGKRFNAALLNSIIHQPGSEPPPEAIRKLGQPITAALERYHEEMDPRSARELFWQRYFPYLHVAAAMYDLSLTRGWEVEGSAEAEGLALKDIVFNSTDWADELVALAEVKRSSAWIYKIANPRKMVRVVLD